MTEEVIVRKCAKCGEEKPLSAFHSNVAKPNNLDPMCRKCRNEYNRAYYHQHLEENRERSRKYAEEHKEEMVEKNRLKYINNKQEIDARNKAYQQSEAGRIRMNVLQKQYRERYPERVKESSRKQREDPDYHKKHAAHSRRARKTPLGKIADSRHRHRRQSLKKKTECTLTLKQWEKILKMQNNKCAECKVEFSEDCPPTKDHIIPLSLGGGLTFGNIQALCRSCNSSKNNRFHIGNAIENLLVEDI